jgi:hypothetical protein
LAARGAARRLRCLLLAQVCCARPSTNGNSNSNAARSNTPTETTTPAVASNEPAGDPNAASHEPSPVALSAGAYVVKRPRNGWIRSLHSLCRTKTHSLQRTRKRPACQRPVARRRALTRTRWRLRPLS